MKTATKTQKTAKIDWSVAEQLARQNRPGKWVKGVSYGYVQGANILPDIVSAQICSGEEESENPIYIRERCKNGWGRPQKVDLGFMLDRGHFLNHESIRRGTSRIDAWARKYWGHDKSGKCTCSVCKKYRRQLGIK